MSGRRRGRPPTFCPEMAAITFSLFPEVKSERGKREVLHAQRAFNILMEGSSLWFFDIEAMRRGESRPLHRTVLAELGRFPNDADVITFALLLNKLGTMPIKEAALRLRCARLRISAADAEKGMA